MMLKNEYKLYIDQDLHTVDEWFINNNLKININQPKYISSSEKISTSNNTPINIKLM